MPPIRKRRRKKNFSIFDSMLRFVNLLTLPDYSVDGRSVRGHISKTGPGVFNRGYVWSEYKETLKTIEF